MESHGGNVELISLVDGVARLRLEGSCSDCSRLQRHARAGDQAGAGAGGARPGRPRGGGHRTAIAGGSGARAGPRSGVGRRIDLARPAARRAHWPPPTSAGCSLVVANVDGTLLAYADRCAGCDGPLDDGRLADGALQCPSCERTFFLPRAGRSMDGDRLQLEPGAAAARQRLRQGGAAGVSENAGGNGARSSAGRTIEQAVAARRRAQLVSGLRGMARGAASEADAGPAERCDICGTGSPTTTATCCNLYERRIVCVCESCWALRSGDAEYRPAGSRTLWLPRLRPAGRCSGRASGSRSAWPSSWTRPPRDAWSRSTPAPAARPRASCTSRRGTGWSS